MRAGIYCRVSTDMQAEDGFSISAQLNLLNEYCKKNSIDVVNAYVDEGISGQKENRPEFQKMIHDAEQKKFDIILVHKFDRFARKVELSQRIKRQLRQSGINVVSITEPVEDSPIGFFTEGIMELLGEWYVRNLSVESKKGHVERARQGYHNGSIPFGYKPGENGEMVIDTERADTVRYIFDLYVNQGYGSGKVAQILNNAGIKTAVSGHWGHYTVRLILMNVKYIGKIMYDGKIYEGHHKPIIDEETFQFAERYRIERTSKREYRGINFRRFLLTGLIRCGECGKTFRIHPCKKSKNSNEKVYFYTCLDSHKPDAYNQCTHKKYYMWYKLESSIMDKIKEAINDIPISSIKRISPVANMNKERYDKIKKELQRAKEAYLSGVFDLKEYSQLRDKYEQELLQINTSKDSKLEMQEKAKTLFTEYETQKTIPEQKAVLKEFIDCIYVYRDKIRIDFAL